MLDRRRGNPISLGVVYLAVAARLGLELTGTNMPQRFLLQLRLGGAGEPTSERVFVDVAERGKLLSEEDCRQRLEQLAHQPGYPSPHTWSQVRAPAHRGLSLSAPAHFGLCVFLTSHMITYTVSVSTPHALLESTLARARCACRPALTSSPYCCCWCCAGDEAHDAARRLVAGAHQPAASG